MRLFLSSALGVSFLALATVAQASPQADAPPPASGAPSVAPTNEPPPTPPVVPPPPPAPTPPPQATAAPPVAAAPSAAPPAPPTAQETPPANEAPAPEKAPLPYAMRGGIEVGVSALKFGRASQLVPTAMLLGAHLPVAEGTFVDLRLPFAVATLGNPQVGAHHARALADGVWLSVGGSLGLPLVTDGPNDYAPFQVATAFTNFSDFHRDLVPFAVRAGLEVHASVAELRFQAEPLWGVSTRDEHFFAFQHAFEAQLGHALGAGLRYQGVAFGTNPARSGDYYQGAVEPFVRAAYGALLGRFGVVFPLDTPLNGGTTSASSQSWGVNATLAYQVQ